MRPGRTAALAMWTFAVALGTLAAAEDDLLQRARAQRRASNLEAAAALLREAVDQPGAVHVQLKRTTLLRELGEVLLEQRRGSAAARRFEAALEIEPGRAVVHYQAGLAYRMAGDEVRAAGHLVQATELGFRTTGALLHLAGAQLSAGQFGAGLRTSRELLALQPRSQDLLVQVGRQLFDHFFYADALEAFEAALDTAPDSFAARMFCALTNHLLNRYEEAVRLLGPLESGGHTPESSTLHASALARLGRIPEAEDLLHAVIERHPDSPHAYVNLALVLLEQDRMEEAEARLDALRQLGSSASPKVFYIVGRNSCGPVADRLAQENLPAPREPSRAQAYFELALSFAARHHHATAVDMLRLARRYEGSTPRTLQALAVSCLHLDPHSPAAVSMLNAALEAEPDLAEAHHLLGRAHLRQGRPDLAVASHRGAVALAPENPAYLTELARALSSADSETGRTEAVAIFRKAAALAPDNALARYGLAKLLLESNHVRQAAQALRDALEAEPGFYNAHYLLGQALLRLDLREQARKNLAAFEELQAAAQARTAVGSGFASGY